MSHYCAKGACIVTIPDNRDYCPEHELHYDTEPPRPAPHNHQFVIPVEWTEEEHVTIRGEKDGSIDRTVTKLRCSCGKEQKR